MMLLSRVLVLLCSTPGLVLAGVAQGQPSGRLVVLTALTQAQAVVQKQATSVQITRTGPSGQPVDPAITPSSDDEELPKKVFAEQAKSENGKPEESPKTDESKKAARLQKLQQLTLDRRPSTILRAWASLGGAEAANPPSSQPPAKPSEPDPFEDELKALQRSVTMGQWDAVKVALKKFPEEEAKAGYTRILETLPTSAMTMGQAMMIRPEMVQQMAINPQWMEQNSISNADVIGLALAAPYGRDETTLNSLGQLLTVAKEQGHSTTDFLSRARVATTEPADAPALPRREVAKILNKANLAAQMVEFLPEAAKAETDGDAEALNLLAVHYLAVYGEKKQTAALEQAWKVVQAALANATLAGKPKDESLRLAVELAPQVREELGQKWLDESFGQRPERGKEILAAIGTATAQGFQLHPMDPSFRRKSLELQKTAVDALLRAAPNRATEWHDTLELLARGWLAEADFSQMFDQSTSLGPQMQRDPFGNIYFGGNTQQQMMLMQQQQQGNMPQAIPVSDLLPVRPDAAWLNQLSSSLQPRFDQTLAQLYLKVNEEEAAFPCIERLAARNPEPAKTLAEEFLRVWTQNHDPNAARNRTNPYMFMFGFERRAEGIPLTRSKQERNLKELADWVGRLRSLPIGNLDESLLTAAFTACHSSSEVYKLEAIESVFGSFEALKPETLSKLIEQMRGNLASVWRLPAEQEKNKTNRREKDIRAEVVRGYELATAVIDRGLTKFPDAWSLVLAKASILHDENNYRQELEPGPDFTKNRQHAFDEFERAAQLYAARVPDLAQEQESLEPFQTWFYAGLGASDLAQVQEKQLADRRQPERIKAVLESLKGEAGERHRTRFANDLFTRMSSANPAVKYRYLENGFAIVGDHPRAHEARKVFDYYKDLVTEIQLVTKIDGNDVVGHSAPFGLFVNLRHTKDIERESGGFGRYLQNQNSGTMFTYNYGRPLENYRDKFEQAARAALQEQFEVLSVTFQVETVNSRSAEPYGWRETPYAYLLLKARSPKVDKIAPLRLDLDFLDTSGYAVLPIESPVLPVDARPETTPARPYKNLKLTQTLDERQSDKGRFDLEIKATALGLVPDLASILTVPPAGFEVAVVEDKGVAVSRFDPESPENAIDTERQWLVSLRANPKAESPVQAFQFPPSTQDGVEVTYQRYNDADLEEVQAEVPLVRAAVAPKFNRLWWLAGGLVLGFTALMMAWRWFQSRPTTTVAVRFPVPENITPFSVLGLLRSIEQKNGLSPAGKSELATTINRIERHYFLAPEASDLDLRGIAESWARKSR